jgi:hypothetical protein
LDEQRWLTCADLWQMLDYLRGKVSDRKLRLFAVACCHRPYYRVADERQRRAVLLAERMADEVIGEEEWKRAHQAAAETWRAVLAEYQAAQQDASRDAREVESLKDAEMATAAGWAILEDAWDASYGVTAVDWGATKKHADEPAHQLALLRDIFGNPFRPVIVDPAWLAWHGGAVRQIAEAAYQERQLPSGQLDPVRLAVVADALEEAGCTDAELLEHLRLQGSHVRGCCVLDVLTGRSG